MRYLLFYEKAPDHAARSVPFQATHLVKQGVVARRRVRWWDVVVGAGVI